MKKEKLLILSLSVSQSCCLLCPRILNPSWLFPSHTPVLCQHMLLLCFFNKCHCDPQLSRTLSSMEMLTMLYC